MSLFVSRPQQARRVTLPELTGEARFNALAHSRTARVVGAIALVLALWFMFARVSGSWAEIGPAISRARLGPLFASVALVLMAELIFVANWHGLISGLGGALTLRRSFKAYSLSGIARFLPGAIMAHVGRAGLAVRYGARPRVATVSTAAETVLSALAALAFGLVGSADLLGARFNTGVRSLLGGIVLVVTVVAAPHALKLISDQTERIALPRILLTIGGYLTAWLCLGLSLYTLTIAFAPPNTPLPSPLATTGGIAIAWLAGMAAVVVPSGLGVREAAIASLLTGPLGAAGSVVVAVAHRLVWWLVTVGLFTAGKVMPLASNGYGTPAESKAEATE